jgi:hypothetical protein
MNRESDTLPDFLRSAVIGLAGSRPEFGASELAAGVNSIVRAFSHEDAQRALGCNRQNSMLLSIYVRSQLIQAERATLKHFVNQGRLAASLYYSWDGDFPG